MTGVVGRFVKCRGIMFTQPVHRDKPPQMGHHYLWGSKHHNLAYTTIYGQYTGRAQMSNTLAVWLHPVGVTSSECFSCRSVHWLTECPTFLGFSTLAEHHMLLQKKSIGSYRNSNPPSPPIPTRSLERKLCFNHLWPFHYKIGMYGQTGFVCTCREERVVPQID